MATLGEILKTSRKNIDLTLRQVEDFTGISNAYLSQLENDKIKKPSASVLYKLSELYKIELNDLLAASGVIKKSKSVSKSNKSRNIDQKFAYSAENLSINQKEEVLNFMEFLKKKESK